MNSELQSVLTNRKTFYHHAATFGIVIPLVGFFWGLFYEGYRLDHLPQSHLREIVDAVFQETIPIMCFLGFVSSIAALFGILRYGSEGIAGKSLAGFVICLLVGVLFGTMRLMEIPNLLVEIAWQPPAQLAGKIVGTDQVVITDYFKIPNDESAPISLSGDKAKEIVNAVSAARRDTGNYTSNFGRQIEFYKGTNLLASVRWQGRLFLAEEG